MLRLRKPKPVNLSNVEGSGRIESHAHISFAISVLTALWKFLCNTLKVTWDKICLGLKCLSFLTADAYYFPFWLHITFMQLNFLIAEVSLHPKTGKECKGDREWNKNTKPASVTVSSVQPVCILMETALYVLFWREEIICHGLWGWHFIYFQGHYPCGLDHCWMSVQQSATMTLPPWSHSVSFLADCRTLEG